MILVAHIAIAITSLLFTAVVLLAPSARKLQVSYGLVALTLASGTYLIVSTKAHMLQACMAGFLYLCLVGLGLFSARSRLAAAKAKQQ